jgi:hypothetical protein
MSLAFARAFRAFLLGKPSVQNVLPGGIHPDMIPQEAQFPAAAYTVSSTPVASITGILPVRSADLVLHLRGNNPTQIEEASTAIQNAIAETPGHITEQNALIAGLRITSDSADVEVISDGDDEPYHTGELNISGWVREL